jgi:hypothetical protein
MNDSERTNSDSDAVTEVEQAVRSFNEQVQRVVDSARLQARKKVKQVKLETDRRRGALDRARQETAAAQAALAGCRGNCGHLAQLVAAARQREVAAEADLARATRALHDAEDMTSQLNVAARDAENVVRNDGHAALANLKEFWTRITDFAHSGFVQNAIITAKVLSEVAGVAGPIANPPTLNVEPITDATTIAAQAEATREDQQLWAESEKVRAERRRTDPGPGDNDGTSTSA